MAGGRARPNGGKPLPVVGLGASAGGLEAYSQLLRELPPHTGMAFVVVQHLDPTHDSMLLDLLGRQTGMPVVGAEDGMAVAPDHVYVIPPNVTLLIARGILRLQPRDGGNRPHLPIDRFFESLAADRTVVAIGVLLSGTGSDGTQGLLAIRAAGGLTFAQEPTSAKHDAMPRSAIAGGGADHVLPPHEIARQLVQLGQRTYLRAAAVADRPAPLPKEAFEQVFHRLREATGVDFDGYKQSTIQRRIARRLAVHRMADLGEYARYLREHPEEVPVLYEDLVIHVTGFFRDQEAFEALSRTVLPAILKRTPPDGSIRLWVLGCSTGEEAYSLAICILEVLDRARRDVPVKIFASDISDESLQRARAGVYPEGIRRDVSERRLKRFFVEANGGYRIGKRVRDLCVFVRHDLFCDPPLARLDLISCRNLLIYLGPELQARAIPVFHYALNPKGYLLVGRSETLNRFGDRFQLVDKASRIYVRKPGQTRPPIGAPALAQAAPEGRRPAALADIQPQRGPDLQRAADDLLLARYVPPGVVVDAEMTIVQFRGRTGAYLEPTPGKAELNLLKMVREGLMSELRIALHRAKQTDAPVRREGVEVRTNGDIRTVAVDVLPITQVGAGANERHFLVLFDEGARREAPPPPTSRRGGGRAPQRGVAERDVARLREELASTKGYLLSLVEAHEATNEELQSTNEEVLSANEELQSTNEELETAKEELQSANEELNTVNEELHHRNQELGQLNADLGNLLASIDLGVVLLSADRRIRQYTPQAERLLNLIPADVGRPLGDLRPNLHAPDLDARITQVIETGSLHEREVYDKDGRCYRMQLRPYLGGGDTIDGCVLVLLDVTDLKHAERVLRFLDAASQRLAASLDYRTTLASVAQLAVPDLAEWCLVHLVGADGSLERVAEAYAESPSGAQARELLRLYPLLKDSPPGVAEVIRSGRSEVVSQVADTALAAVARDEAHLQALREWYPRSYMCMPLAARGRTLGAVTFAAAPAQIYGRADAVMAEDLARRAALAVDTARLFQEVQDALRVRTDFLADASHELRTPLTVVKGHLHLVARALGSQETEAAGLVATAIRHVDGMTRLLTDLLDATRLAAGAEIPLEREPLDLREVVAEALAIVESLAEQKRVALVNALDSPVPVRGDVARLGEAVLNLLTNAIKYTPAEGTVRIETAVSDGYAELRVRDTGVGLAREHLERIFEPFFQVSRGTGRRKGAGGGAGLGLSIVKHLIERHGGRVWAESEGPGRGSTFTIGLQVAAPSDSA